MCIKNNIKKNLIPKWNKTVTGMKKKCANIEELSTSNACKFVLLIHVKLDYL